MPGRISRQRVKKPSNLKSCDRITREYRSVYAEQVRPEKHFQERKADAFRFYFDAPAARDPDR